MFSVFTFILGFVLGVEVQTWWHNKGAKKFVEWQLSKRRNKNDC